MQIPYFLNYIMSSSVACVPLPPCPTLSHKRYDYQWNVADHKIIHTITVLNTTHSEKTSSYWHKRNYVSFKVTYSSVLAGTWIFSTRVRKKIIKHQILWKPVHCEQSCTVQRAEIAKPIVTWRPWIRALSYNYEINHLNAEFNPICHLLILLGI
jgi:hypothetical protein